MILMVKVSWLVRYGMCRMYVSLVANGGISYIYINVCLGLGSVSAYLSHHHTTGWLEVGWMDWWWLVQVTLWMDYLPNGGV